MFLHRSSRFRTARLGLPGLLLLALVFGATPAYAEEMPLWDVAAVGATISGRAGDVVEVTIGVKSIGSEPAKKWRDSYGAVYWTFKPPAGTTVVKAPPTNAGAGMPIPNSCEVSDLDEGQYVCYSAPILNPGESSTAKFSLKITKAAADAAGTVAVKREWTSGGRPDANQDNDEAAVVINPSSSGGLGTSPAGFGVGTISAGVIGVLLAVGAMLYVSVRRRRAPATRHDVSARAKPAAGTARTDGDLAEVKHRSGDG